VPTVLDPLIAYDWVFTLLKADATLTTLNGGRTFIDEAPKPTTPYPMTLIQSLSNVPLVVLGGVLVQMGTVVMVKSVDQSRTYTRIRPIANRIVTLLNDQMGTTPTGQVFSCVLDGVDLLPEKDAQSGLDFRNIIQRWRLAFA
jgi:hypothetical protein